MRQPAAAVRPSTMRQPSSLSSSSRGGAPIDRAGATSPADSVSTATTGMKRKERDYESDIVVAGGEETNINVVVRCRGRSQREVKENSTVVVSADGVKGKAVELSLGPNAMSNKSYSFDRVYSQAADQNMVFDDTVRPILDEVCFFLPTNPSSERMHIHDVEADANALGFPFWFRCLPDTTAPFSRTARPARAKHTQCPAT